MFWIAACCPIQGRLTVVTNGHTGHVPRAPGFLFFLRGPQLVLAVVKYFLKLIILLLMLLHDCTNTSKIDLQQRAVLVLRWDSCR